MKNQQIQLQIQDKNNQERLQRLAELEGQCKITEITFLQINYLKAIFLFLPVFLFGVGIWFLKHCVPFRRMLLYTQLQSIETATHIYVVGNHGQFQQIVSLQKEDNINMLTYKKLKYQVYGKQVYPKGFKYWIQYEKYFNEQHIKSGLTKSEVIYQQKQFGQNIHEVDIPWYTTYMFQILIKPFFLIQYLMCVIYAYYTFYLFAGLLIGLTLLTTTINYFLLFFSYLKIKKIAQETCQVKVIRDGSLITLESNKLVPGDIFSIQKDLTVPCDCILIKGQAYVNQATLTGQSTPVSKFAVQKKDQLQEKSIWLYQGCKILASRNQAKALVINTGYKSHRGKIIRRITNKDSQHPDIFKSAIAFFAETFIIGIIIYLATIPLMLSSNLPEKVRILRFFQYFGWGFPPTFPIYFNLAYSMALYRLRKKNIFGTQPQKTVDSVFFKSICFDKTGTLTQNSLKTEKIMLFQNQNYRDISVNQLQQKKKQNNIRTIFSIFSTCHSVKIFDGKMFGDQVDLRMFQLTKCSIQVPKDQHIKFTIQNTEGDKYQILQITEYESKLQHMSVIVYDSQIKKHYLFIKGAPERIHNMSIKKYSYFDQLLKKMSLSGLRTIGFAYKQLSEEQVNYYKNNQISKDIMNKNNNQKNDMTMIGLIAFQNKLKSDATETMKKLQQCNIQTRIITGDNIYIGIETAIRSGIIKKQQNTNQILVLQGRNQNKQTNSVERIFKGNLLHFGKNPQLNNDQFILLKEQPIQIEQKNLNQSLSGLIIAIDNDFLTLNPRPQITENIKVFARITPQNKALIIKILKNQINQVYNTKNILQKIASNKPKIGMVGDGANDLMALKQADVGFGINQSDASYGSCFTIEKLSNVQQVLRESKNTSTIIIQCIGFFGTISFLRIPCALLMLTQTTYFNATHLYILNFSSTVIIPMVMTLGKPVQEHTPLKPIVNFFSLKNHLIFWGNVIIPTIYIVTGYFYFKYTPDFIPNPVPRLTKTGFYSLCQTTTVTFLLVIFPYTLNGFFMYNVGHKFKEIFYKNYALLILIVGNLIANIVYLFNTKGVSQDLLLVEIPTYKAGILFAFTIIYAVIAYIYNQLIGRLNLDQKQFMQQNPKFILPSISSNRNRIANETDTTQMNFTEPF